MKQGLIQPLKNTMLLAEEVRQIWNRYTDTLSILRTVRRFERVSALSEAKTPYGPSLPR